MIVRLDQAVELFDQVVELGPVVAARVVVVAWMLHVRGGGGELDMASGELFKLFGGHVVM
jgi:hypothetical protein